MSSGNPVGGGAADRATGREVTVRLFRAIGESELAHLLKVGDYGFSPSAGGKYFALTEEGVRRFAATRFNVGRRMTITAIEVPVSLLGRGFRFVDFGGAGDSIHFADDVLPDLYRAAGLVRILNSA